jgi:hypothetical protein
MHCLFLYDEEIEVACHGSKQHEDSIFVHKRLGQPLPSKVVVYLGEDAFFVSSLVVEQDDFLLGLFPVVGEYAPVCVFTFEQVVVTFQTLLPLNYESAVPDFIERDERERAKLILLIVNLGLSPVSVFLYLVIKPFVAFSPYVEPSS